MNRTCTFTDAVLLTLIWISIYELFCDLYTLSLVAHKSEILTMAVRSLSEVRSFCLVNVCCDVVE